MVPLLPFITSQKENFEETETIINNTGVWFICCTLYDCLFAQLVSKTVPSSFTVSPRGGRKRDPGYQECTVKVIKPHP